MFALDLLFQCPVGIPAYHTLNLAQNAKCQSYLGSRCAQRYLDDLW